MTSDARGHLSRRALLRWSGGLAAGAALTTLGQGLLPSVAAAADSNAVQVSAVDGLADEQLKALARRVLTQVELAADKVAAHYAEPDRYPLPEAPDSLEQRLRKRFAALAEAKQYAYAQRVLPRIRASQAERIRRYGDLAQVDLRSPLSVEEQVRRLPRPAHLKLSGSRLVRGQLSPVGCAELDKLEFLIHRVRAVDETGSGVGEWGEDDIRLGGTTVDESGDVNRVGDFAVGDFDDGDAKTYDPPRRFTWFNLREGDAFPKSYFVTLVLAEEDNGGLAAYLGDLFEKVGDMVAKEIGAAAGAAAGAVIGGLIGAAIGAAVGWALGELIDLIADLFDNPDDIFPPRTLRIDIPSLCHRFANGAAASVPLVAEFRGHDGVYRLSYSWRLFS